MPSSIAQDWKKAFWKYISQKPFLDNLNLATKFKRSESLMSLDSSNVSMTLGSNILVFS